MIFDHISTIGLEDSVIRQMRVTSKVIFRAESESSHSVVVKQGKKALFEVEALPLSIFFLNLNVFFLESKFLSLQFQDCFHYFFRTSIMIGKGCFLIKENKTHKYASLYLHLSIRKRQEVTKYEKCHAGCPISAYTNPPSFYYRAPKHTVAEQWGT